MFLALFVAAVSLYIYTLTANPLYREPVPHVQLGKVNITTSRNWGLGGSLLFYNRSLPYQANVTYAPREGEKTAIKHFDFCGVHFWALESLSLGNWWTLAFSLWYPMAFFALFPCMRVFKRVASQPSEH